MFNCESDLQWIFGSKTIEDIVKIQHFSRQKKNNYILLIVCQEDLMVIKINLKLNQCFEQILFISPCQGLRG